MGRIDPRENTRAQVKPWGGHVLAAGLNSIGLFEDCTCGAYAQVLPAAAIHAGQYGIVVHVAGCAKFSRGRRGAVNLPPPSSSLKLLKKLIIPGQPTWKPPQPLRRNRRDQQSSTNYKLLLQFHFNRPIDINLWKRIKAPRGWRKCPTGKAQQSKYFGVRFQCRDLKYSLTPGEIEELRARLYMCLEVVF